MNFEIKKGVPLPPIDKSQRTGLVGAMRRMDIGDCIEGFSSNESLVTISKQAGIRIATRKQPDGTYTIWRIA